MQRKEAKEINQEAKEIMENFGKTLTKIPLDQKTEHILSEKGWREETSENIASEEFRRVFFLNAPNKNKESIIAEKKKW